MGVFNQEYFYIKATDAEKLRFKNIISAIIDTTLSMVKNGVVVLPSDLSKNAKQSIYKHIEIATMDKQTAFQKYKYDNVMSLKDIFLECLPNKDNIFFKKIKFVFYKNFINTIGLDNRQHLINDILYFEKIINDNNKRFTKLLPQALIERKKIMKMMIKKTPVPKKAIYRDNIEFLTDKSL